MKLKKFLPFILLSILPLLILATKQIIDLRKDAAGLPANIFIDTQNPGSNLSTSLWQNLSQGGEEPVDMIKPVIGQIRALSPKLIRIDHVFDFYKVDQGNNNYDFSRLDGVVDSILATGAKPMLSLSYTPDSKPPADWNQWYSLIKATAKHYSVEKKISGIYYEVWNEPDLFGGWHYAKDPNYTTLYHNTARAVVDGAGNAPYKIGGPAITAYYANWIKSLFASTARSGIRLDFISWHKYSKNPADYLADFYSLNKILSNYPQHFDVERIISEIGPNPKPDSWYDQSQSGVHLISIVTQLTGKIHRIFTFEPVDGPNPRSNKSSGWGLITHSSKGNTPKPRYYAIQFLNQLGGQLIPSNGDGTWVTSLSTKNGNKYQSLIVNYDQYQNHSETFPVSFKGLKPGAYTVTIKRYLGKTSSKKITIDTPTLTENIYMTPNSAIIIEITN
ncbi:hypothetical protein COZ41_02725 [Candidatus Shapirobacteria bacterium CG_4_10_14_3_um_filter_35_13]|uniref:Glycosyl hydrolases family 39 N-terminal catalytic domain-containing protein n=1 Tax=Candidatus Shapirobacteria bacterium CG_4_10_14_3_um_filter_35_13 TaxID=1974873 RepID=A0A2M7LIL9_9BACT|nr:MAG: hypothetical protein COZ41_02725 [Candidatus Shapirobacteria bacterium CG_4_10_14_3_um_filter_35_13]